MSLAECFQEVFLVIDALDECPKSQRPYVIGFITEVISSLPCAKIFIMSRRESDIVRAFESSNTPTIQIRAENVAADIERFVCSEVDKLRQGYHGKKLHLNSSACERRIINTLIEKADGMYVTLHKGLEEVCLQCNRFLWVNLQLESLCQISEVRKDRLVEAALDDLPRGLDDTYARIVERIDGQQGYMRELVLNCFSWVFYAQRPLGTVDLQHALATKSGCKDLADLDLDEVDVILEACGNLLVEESSVIRPIHFSVQEFFTNPPRGVLQGSILEKIAEPSSMHESLARIYLQYVQFGVSNHPSPNGIDLWYHLFKTPFARYAAQCFDSHILNCKDFTKDILDLLEELLRRDGSFLAAILQIRYLRDTTYLLEKPMDFDPTSFPVSASTIIYGTHLYDIPYLRARWATHDLPRYALHSASSVGLSSVVERLLTQGCDVDEMNGRGVRPIHFAARGGHLPIVELFMSRGADVNTQGGDFGSVLQAASFGGRDSIVELLTSRGADVNAQGGFYGNALQAASVQGYNSIIELLISGGADINTQGGYYGNALQAASAQRHKSTVELLINRSADINAQGGYYGNALQAASAWGCYNIIELLISKGTDINAQGGYYGNALQAALHYGTENIVELLIDKGADVNAQAKDFGSALQAASAEGKNSTVELLISRGADINVQGPYGDALQVASFRGRYDTVELLLDRGADVTAKVGGHGSALQAASIGGHYSIVELLISRGADVKAQGGANYGLNTALQAASAMGHDSIVELLISKGADVNARGGRGRYDSALQAASGEGENSTVELLISKGADINAQGGFFGNVLQAALARGHNSTVELLKSRGANVISQKSYYFFSATNNQSHPAMPPTR